MMLGERDALGREYQRIAAIPVGFREGAVNGHRAAAALDRLFAFFDFNRHVAVDDQTLFRYAKLGRNSLTEILIIKKSEVRVLVFFARFFVFDEIVFKSGHAIFAKEG